MSKLKQILTCILFVLASAMFCDGKIRLSLIELVPPGSLTVVKANWKVVRNDPILKSVIKGAKIETILNQLGLEDKAIEVAVFTNNDETNAATSGFIIVGTFDSRDVINSWRGQSSRSDLTVYNKMYDHDPGVSVAALSRDTLVVGTRPGVEAVIDVATNKVKGLCYIQPFSHMAARFRPEWPVSAFIIFPDVYLDATEVVLKVSSAILDYKGLGGIGTIIEKLGSAKGAGFSLASNAGSLKVDMLAIMGDDDAARLASGALNLLKGLSKAVESEKMSRDDRDAMQMFQQMLISRDHEILSIKFQIPSQSLSQ